MPKTVGNEQQKSAIKFRFLICVVGKKESRYERSEDYNFAALQKHYELASLRGIVSWRSNFELTHAKRRNSILLPGAAARRESDAAVRLVA